MLEMIPALPLRKGPAVSIGVTSYDGGVSYGLNADLDALPDLEVLAGGLPETLGELAAAVAR